MFGLPQIVLQNAFLGCVQFFQGRWCAHLKIMWGAHDQFDFQPAAFVGLLQGIGSRKARFDGHAAEFSRRVIFEFCNTIPGKRIFIATVGCAGPSLAHFQYIYRDRR